jgi:hypothetical protein
MVNFLKYEKLSNNMRLRVHLLRIKKLVILILNNLEITFERFYRKIEFPMCLFIVIKITFLIK